METWEEFLTMAVVAAAILAPAASNTHHEHSSTVSSGTSYSFTGFAVLAMGAAAVRVGRRRDNSGDNVQDGEDTYIEMAEPQ